MENRFVTIKDAEGILRPLAYLERIENHNINSSAKLQEGDHFVEIELVEVF